MAKLDDEQPQKVLVIPTHEQLVAWFKAKHISFWGRGFQMEKEGPSRAADYMLEQLNSLYNFLKEETNG